MVNAEIRTLLDPDGTPVCNVAFDLSPDQLRAAAYATGEVVLERHRGEALDVEGVIALRELTGLRDELDHLAEAGANARLVMPLARFAALHDAVDEYSLGRGARGWQRSEDEKALPIVDALLGPMAALRADAVTAALADPAPSA